MSDKDAIMKGLIEGLVAKAKNAHRDTKITTIAGSTHIISGHSVQDQEIAIGDVSVSWTDGSRTYLIPYSSIDHILMV
ncbi:hypothetical protein [Methylocapsa acidiphila]|uniref:hypothetical protein n=1 Tax=Methylocapsa acidiphila TaxID=133552 RepID=UPI00047B12C2|nr:hypothetical protein [Methylocapsa acidiphila]